VLTPAASLYSTLQMHNDNNDNEVKFNDSMIHLYLIVAFAMER